MNERLLQIIQYKTGGVQTEFCALMGWSPQYLGKLLKGVNFGIVPVLAVVKAFPEINARWFLTGEGDMLDGRFDSVRSAVRSHVDRIYELERFIPVMTPSELHDFQQALSGAKKSISQTLRKCGLSVFPSAMRRCMLVFVMRKKNPMSYAK